MEPARAAVLRLHTKFNFPALGETELTFLIAKFMKCNNLYRVLAKFNAIYIFLLIVICLGRL